MLEESLSWSLRSKCSPQCDFLGPRRTRGYLPAFHCRLLTFPLLLVALPRSCLLPNKTRYFSSNVQTENVRSVPFWGTLLCDTFPELPLKNSFPNGLTLTQFKGVRRQGRYSYNHALKYSVKCGIGMLSLTLNSKVSRSGNPSKVTQNQLLFVSSSGFMLIHLSPRS